jgi:GNAT superfamily N-acetyltransferase
VLLGSNDRYEVHSLEVLNCDPAELAPVAKACQAVEETVWQAHENFLDYLAKQTALFYAKEGEKIVAFALFDVALRDETLVVTVNECMVMPGHQGQGLPNIFLSLLVSHLRYHRRQVGVKRRYKRVVAMASTVNFKMMHSFHRYSFLTLSNPYRPCPEITAIAWEYLEREGLEPVEAGNPFYAKSAYPGSLKEFPGISAPVGLPQDFSQERGDSFLFVGKIGIFWPLGIAARFILWSYGFRNAMKVRPIKRFKIYRKRDKRPVIYTKPE